MLAGFLFDVHIPLSVLGACRHLLPDVGFEHIAQWRGGALRTAPDEVLLTAAAESGLIVVTYDTHTFRPLGERWIAEGRRFPGIVLIVVERIAPTNVGAIARGLRKLYLAPRSLDPAYPITYLRGPD